MPLLIDEERARTSGTYVNSKEIHSAGPLLVAATTTVEICVWGRQSSIAYVNGCALVMCLSEKRVLERVQLNQLSGTTSNYTNDLI
jgi:hypothetical protein